MLKSNLDGVISNMTPSLSIVLRLENKTEIEQWVATMSLGICTAIVGGSLTIAEAEARLFNPHTLEQLETLGLAQDLLEIVHLGTELEDVQSLIPERLSQSLTEIEAKALTFLNGIDRSAQVTYRAKSWI